MRIETLFASGSRILADYDWLEAHLGPLVPIEVVLDFDAECPVPLAVRLALLERVEAELRGLEGVGGPGVLSLWPIRTRRQVEDAPRKPAGIAWSWLAGFLARHPVAVAGLGAALMVGTGWGLRQAAHDLCDVTAEDIHLAGPVIDGLEVDLASHHSLDRLLLPSVVLMLVVTWWSLRSLRASLLVLGISLFGQAATLALLHYGGERMNAVLIILPPLVQVVAITGGIHLVNYFFDVNRRADPAEAGRQALRMGWLPCVLSAATTAVGLASLMMSDLSPIRTFGAYAAAGVMLTAGLLLAGRTPVWAQHGSPQPARRLLGRKAQRRLQERGEHLASREHALEVPSALRGVERAGAPQDVGQPIEVSRP